MKLNNFGMPCSSTNNSSPCASNGLKAILESGGDPFLMREFIALCDFFQKKPPAVDDVENE